MWTISGAPSLHIGVHTHPPTMGKGCAVCCLMLTLSFMACVVGGTFGLFMLYKADSDL
ncbi:hypothetical protein KIPB_010678, partial [Kipferlia bialata]|eukprot:g10678.t1